MEMDAGMDNKALEQITGIPSVRFDAMRKVFQKYSAIESVRVFGSRANGKFNDQSGVNLALLGVLDAAQLKPIAQDLDALKTGYVFDVRAYSDMSYPPLRKHVDTEGVEVYRVAPSQIQKENLEHVDPTEIVVRPRRSIPWAILAGVAAFVVASLVFWGALSAWVVPMSFAIGPFALLIPFVIPLFFAAVIASLVKVLAGAIRFFREGMQ